MSVTIVAVKCPHCNTCQKVHIIGRTGTSQMAQHAKCLACQQPFEVMLPNNIVAGPFPAFALTARCVEEAQGENQRFTALAA
jgi:hypothetical protein